MDSVDKQPGPPRLTTVLILVAAFAVVVSWLACYAVPNALIAADVIKAWPHEHDPRPRWMLSSFLSLFAGFAVIGFLFRWVSNRQLKNIDAIADAEDKVSNRILS